MFCINTFYYYIIALIQVIQCELEPDLNDREKHTNIIATCGGNTVCFTDITTAEIEAKFTRKTNRLHFISFLIELDYLIS